MNNRTQEFTNAGPIALNTQEKIEKLISEMKSYVFQEDFMDPCKGITVLCKPEFYRKLLSYISFREKRQWREARKAWRGNKQAWKEARGY